MGLGFLLCQHVLLQPPKITRNPQAWRGISNLACFPWRSLSAIAEIIITEGDGKASDQIIRTV